MTHRHGGQILIECLKALGARHSFGVPGESYLAALDAMHDTAGVFDFTLCRQEGGAAFMAAAYGKLTGKPGICFVTRGPGATNASIGVHTAMQDSVPMLLFIGQVGADMKDREAFQEIDYRAFFGPVAKWATEIPDVTRIPEYVSRAWTTALSGRPGPVVVALPEDVLSAMSGVAALSKPAVIAEPAPSAGAVAQIAARLDAAERPLIITGGQGWTAQGREALQDLAHRSDVPVVAAFRFHDQFDNHSPCYAGEAGVGMHPTTQALIRESDAILAINIRMGEMTTGAFELMTVPEPAQSLFHVHSSDAELGKVYIPDIAVHAGPNAFCAALLEQVAERSDRAWRASARAGYEATFSAPAQPGPVDMVAIMAYLRDHLPQDAVLTNGAGNFAAWPGKFFLFGPGQRLLAPQSGAMGFGVPAAIAAKVADPGRTVVCFAGDGDFQMTCQELGTAAQAGAQPIILILNNGVYGTIRMHQEAHYPERVSGTTLENPDFAALARSYGFHGETVHSTEAFADAFERALASETGAVLDLRVSAEALTPGRTLSQIRDAALRSGG
ncbi:thiamine pyrophosphate-binding protein [uncultured Roseobacter sp.]|uniref:thiamine pyrophosphate-binding protein n=1 Tax=uncultured Roseobacter sp. TaxID=114847 RepID=UPI002606B7CC|nr:thiamine pyrophosphate-binding protein [uncultured Roseobacter sp.]